MGAGQSTGKPFLNTNDLRSDLAKLISNKSSNFFWWTLAMILIFATIVALSWYVFIEVEEGEFWNAEHKGIYYNRAIIGSTIGLHIVLAIILIYVSIEYYNLLKREDNFITDIAVLGDVSKLSANAQPSLKKMIEGRLGKPADDIDLPDVGELGQYLNRGSILGRGFGATAGAAGLLASNTLQQQSKNIINPGGNVARRKLTELPYYIEIRSGTGLFENADSTFNTIEQDVTETLCSSKDIKPSRQHVYELVCDSNYQDLAIYALLRGKTPTPLTRKLIELDVRANDMFDDDFNNASSSALRVLASQQITFIDQINQFIDSLDRSNLWPEFENQSVVSSSEKIKEFILAFKP